MTPEQLAAALQRIAEQVAKIGGETAGTLKKVEELSRRIGVIDGGGVLA